MGTITSLNGVACGDINAVNNLLAGAGGDILKWDDNTFCPVVSPTPTPTNTPTPQPTPTPTPTPVCTPECCAALLCYGKRDCGDACQCLEQSNVFLHLPCGGDCVLSNADGIFEDSECETPAPEGYYVDANNECWYWDGSSSLSFNSNCRR